MSPRRVHKLFAVALIISVLLHATLLMLIGRAIREARWQAEIARVRALPRLMPVELSLGIDAPTPPSETWIGYDKEVPQKAQPAEVEQAAFTDEPVAAAPPPPSPAMEAPEPTPQQDESTETIPEPEQAPSVTADELPAESAPPMPAPPVEVEAPKPVQLPIPEFDETPSADLPVPEPQTTDRPESPNAQELAEWFDDARELMEQAARDAPSQNDTAAASQPAPQQLPSPPSDSPAQPDQALARKSDPSAPNTGAQSDRESDASSIIEVPRDQWELGKPIAAHGLELKPRRPHFTVLTLLTAAPCNPSCEIIFDKAGVATKARLLSGSCDSRVDEAILNSLYGWRASGEPLTKLSEGRTITVGIRLILSRRK